MTAHQKRRAFSLLALTVVTSYAGVCGMCEDNKQPFTPTPHVTITPSGTINVLEGGFVQLTAEVFAIPDPNYVWVSDNEAIATVTQNGFVNAVSEGGTIVRVTVNGLYSSAVTVNVIGPSGAAVVLDSNLAAAYQAGDTILLSRITHGRPADPDNCSTIHLHTAFGEGGILIDGDDGPFTDPNPTQCGFGRIIAIAPVSGMLRAAPMDHGPRH